MTNGRSGTNLPPTRPALCRALPLPALSRPALSQSPPPTPQALLEMLKQTQEKALTDAEAAAQQRRDMESQVEAANKRAQKAKLAAQAALEEL